MKFIATILSAAALLCLAEAEVFDVDWIYGMEDADTAICVPPGSQINFVWETNHNVVLMENKEDFDACTNFSELFYTQSCFHHRDDKKLLHILAQPRACHNHSHHNHSHHSHSHRSHSQSGPG